MAKITTNDYTGIKLFEAVDASDNTKVSIIVFHNANAGWCYFVYRPIVANGKVVSLSPITASKLYVASDAMAILQNLYDSKVSNTIRSQLTGCPVLTNKKFFLTKDVTSILLNSSLHLPMASYKHEAVDSVILNDFILNNFGYPDKDTGVITAGIELKDVELTAGDVQGMLTLNDINGHNPFNNLKPEDQARLTKVVDPDLMAAVQASKAYKEVETYIKYVDSSNPYKNIRLAGKPGTGKSTLPEVFAAAYKLPYAAVTGDPAYRAEELFGYVIPNDSDDSNKPWATAWTDVLKVAQAGGVINFNEANNFHVSVQIALNDVVYGNSRTIKFQDKTYPVHPKTIFFTTNNFGEQGNNPMNRAFLERFYPVLVNEFDTTLYAKFLASKNPGIDAKAINTYVKFMYQIIKTSNEVFEGLDKFSPDTPAVYTRLISPVLMMAFAQKSLQNALFNVMRSLTYGVDDAETKIAGILSSNAIDIAAIEQAFFVDKTVVKTAASELKAFLAYGEDAANVKTSKPLNSIDDMFAKAANVPDADVDSVVTGLNNINWGAL